MLSLFGMMNWFYTWHNPRIDANAKALAEEMSGIFLYGVLPRDKNKRKTAQAKP